MSVEQHFASKGNEEKTIIINEKSDFSIFRLQQLADAAVSLIILIAFSLVTAGASNYIVNERISGEKLQQKLCDVSFKTYWGITFIWDFTVNFFFSISHE